MKRSENVTAVDPSDFVNGRDQFVRFSGFFSNFAVCEMSDQPEADSELTVTVAPPDGSVFVDPEFKR